MDNTQRLEEIRQLLRTRPPGVLISLANVIRDLDDSLSKNGVLPKQWQNADPPLITINADEVCPECHTKSAWLCPNTFHKGQG